MEQWSARSARCCGEVAVVSDRSGAVNKEVVGLTTRRWIEWWTGFCRGGLLDVVDPAVLDVVDPAVLDVVDPAVLDVVDPAVLDVVDPAVLDVVDPAVLDVVDPAVLDVVEYGNLLCGMTNDLPNWYLEHKMTRCHLCKTVDASLVRLFWNTKIPTILVLQDMLDTNEVRRTR